MKSAPPRVHSAKKEIMGTSVGSKEETGLDVNWMKDSFINLTPYVIVLLTKSLGPEYIEVGRLRPYSPGETFRLIREEPNLLGKLRHDVPVVAPPIYTGFEPDPTEWVVPPTANFEKGLIVSSLVAKYWKEIEFEWVGGYYSMDTGPGSCVRYPKGHEHDGEIRGVQRLICWKEPMFNC